MQEGLTPLHAAALSGSARACDVMRVLLEHGAEVNAQTLGDENTSLHLVVENGVFPRDFNIIAFLIENGISLSLRNRVPRVSSIIKPCISFFPFFTFFCVRLLVSF